MSDGRRGLGRGLGALIPTGPRTTDDRPVDMFFGRAGPGSVPRETTGPAPNGGAQHGDSQHGDNQHGDHRNGQDGRGHGAGVQNGGQLADVRGARFAELPLDAVVPNPRQPRQVFDDESMAELVASIREVGLLQPVVVREVTAGRYELVMGERRWRASRAAGRDTIPAIIRSTEDDAMLRDALLENLHRADLNPLEEAAAYQQLLDDFGCTHEELAGRIGRSRPQVSNTLRLLKLPPAVQRRVAAGVLSAGHARALLALPDGDAQERLAYRVVAEGLSVRATEEIVALGGVQPDPAAPARRGPRPVAPGLADLAAALSERFDTRVRVDLGQRKGRITVEFATLADLQRIVSLLDPAAATTLAEAPSE